MSSNPPLTFEELELPQKLLKALDEVGYETPSPIQAQTIPHLLKGHDLLGHAPTGTGKTAAFALPVLARVDMKRQGVQVLVLAPTRELAIQVAEAFQKYASQIKGFHVLPIYGGQEYGQQIRALRRGVHVVVGTPGRVMDHMRKGTLVLDELSVLVLDEADEMLRMGFIDDVEWILDQTPADRQMALFSATMPPEVKKIANQYLKTAKEIKIQAKTATADTIRQRYWRVSHQHKLDALTRILEVEPFDGILMFVRTKLATVELADKLEARGYAAAALNGDMVQKSRESTIEKLKAGALDILVATDVAARGLDVERISHVINYDIPYDTEAYVHRIGRTGRAGRTGDAILFVTPREQRMLSAIEKATRHKIELMELPTTEMVNNLRIANFKQKITDTLGAGELEFMQSIMEQYELEHDVPMLEVAAALAKMALGDQELLLSEQSEQPQRRPERPGSGKSRDSRPGKVRSRGNAEPPEGMERFRIEVGHDHEVQPGNIVGAIANEAGLDAEHIGHIDIRDDYSFVDLPLGMPKDIFNDLKRVWVCNQQLNITRSVDARRGSGKATRQRSRNGPAASESPDRKTSKSKVRKKAVKKKRPGKKERASKNKKTT
ncbi:MAG: DEAD/DEAH box helicase [Gammaproteobacteria bacterium]